MNTISLKCNNCGADLEVAPNIRFVHCTNCSTDLTVVNNDNTIYLQPFGIANDLGEEIAEGLHVAKIERAIDRLDRQWEIKKTELGVKEGWSTTNRFTAFFSLLIGPVVMIGLIFFTFYGTLSRTGMNIGSSHDQQFFLILGVVVLIAIFKFIGKFILELNYLGERDKYRQEREELVKRL